MALTKIKAGLGDEGAMGIKMLTGVTTTYEITVADMADCSHLVLFFTASSTAYNITCPAAAHFTGKMITVINDTAGTGDVALKTNAGATIPGISTAMDGVPSFSTVISNGTGGFKCGESVGVAVVL